MSETIRLLFDENFGRPLVHALIAAAETRPETVEIRHVFDLFPAGADDAAWVAAAAQGTYVVISADRAKRYGGAKLPDVCRALRVTHVLVSARIHHLRTFEKIELICEVWPALLATAAAKRGTRFSLRYMSAKRVALVSTWEPEDDADER